MNKIITIGMTIMLTSCGGGGGGGTDIGAALITAGGSGTGGNGGNNMTTPTVSLSASSYEVVAGDTITLNWSSSNATSCTASGSWSGEQALSGNENIEFLLVILAAITLILIVQVLQQVLKLMLLTKTVRVVVLILIQQK